MLFQLAPQGFRITPETPADEAQLEALGWREGGDWMPLVRVDKRTNGRIKHLQILRVRADADRTNVQEPKSLNVFEAEEDDRRRRGVP